MKVEQLDMMRQLLGDEAFFRVKGAELRAIARELATLAGFKVLAADCETSVSSISMGVSGSNDRDVQLGWLPAFAAHDPERRLGQAIARLYGCTLTPIPQVTPEQEAALLKEVIRQKLGTTGDQILRDLQKTHGIVG